MGEFVAGAYINDAGAICNADGSTDALGRWVDDRGFIRIGADGYEDNWSVDATGQVRDESGQPTVFTLPVPNTLTIVTDFDRDDQASQVMAAMAVERKQGLSGTQGSSPSAQALQDFQGGIARSAPATDALGGDLTWSGGQNPAGPADLHSRALNPQYAGEDQNAAAFDANTMRGKLDPTNTQWTTNYDRDDTESVRSASVNPAGLLVDAAGTPLDGEFGYVVDPTNGQFYTFSPGEGYVSKNGQWLTVAGLTLGQLIGTIQQALTDGEQVSSVHHSTALAGAPVAGAGRMTVTNGQVTEINDESGHYKPEGEYLWQTVSWLHAQGMPVADIEVTMIAKRQEAKLILEGWQLQQSRGNQTQARLKNAVNDEIRGRETARAQAERAGAIVAGSPADLHRRATGCTNFSPSDDGVYCMGCDRDL